MILDTSKVFSVPEETSIDPKEFRNKGCVKPFQQVHLNLDNGLISYYDNPRAARVRQLMLRVVPIKFKQLVMSACHVFPFEGHMHEQRTLFRILAQFWWPMVNN